VLNVPTHGGCPESLDLGGWLYTEIDFPTLGVGTIGINVLPLKQSET